MAGLRSALQSALPTLRPADAAVIRLALTDPGFVIDATVAEVAERAGVSPASVVRATRAVGHNGFSEFRMALAKASTGVGLFSAPPELSNASSPGELADALLGGHIETLKGVRGTLDPETLDRATRALDTAERVLVAGSGTSSAVAVDAAFRLTLAGLMVQSPTDHLSAMLQARMLGERDVVIAVSFTGETPQTLEIATAAREVGATVIAITSFSGSPLTRMADLPLVAGGQETSVRLASSNARLAHLAVVDMLHAGVLLADPARSEAVALLGNRRPEQR